MAKKKSHKLIMTLNSEFSISVSDERREAFLRDLKKKKLCVSVFIETRGTTHSYNIYHDHILNGALIFGELNNGKIQVNIAGTVEKKINSVDDEDLISFIQESPNCTISLKDIYDNDVCSYYVDGIDGNIIPIGTATIH